MRTRLTLLIPAIALATALTGCGDDGPSKAEFTAEADGSCTPGNTTISTTAKPTNAPQVATAAGAASSTIDAQVGSLRAMKIPGGKDKDLALGVINAIAEVGGPTKALQDAAGRSDDAAMAKAAVEMQAKAETASTTAQGYGMSQCGIQLKFGLGNLFDGVKQVIKATYLTKAESLCRDSIRRSEAVGAPGNTLASTSRFLDAQLVISDKLASDLKAITVPPGDEAAVADFLAALDNLNAKGKEVSSAAKSNNPRLVLALVDEVNVAGTALNSKLDAYGLRTCGTVGS